MPENNYMMPYNMDAEQSVLGSILIDQNCMTQAAAELSSEHFYLPEHQKIYSSMLAMYGTAGNAIDVITLADSLEKSGYTGQMGA
ncbi:MAG: replicative DNA helicase, partial [Eubacterium sp.]|nr:replicative DNA helicase [Eubacterium sp.]